MKSFVTSPGMRLADWHDHNLCMTAVSANGTDLEYVVHLNHSLCMAAVKNTGYALKFVPKNMQTYEMCEAAVENAPLALSYVKLKQTESIVTSAIRKYPKTLSYVKKEDFDEATFLLLTIMASSQ